ncbi:hypothetical protein DZB84_09355 [Bacillus sp. HNG]|nr:hypothetical protein DZB84_09355 [Bacillus sp. HNG]
MISSGWYETPAGIASQARPRSEARRLADRPRKRVPGRKSYYFKIKNPLEMSIFILLKIKCQVDFTKCIVYFTMGVETIGGYCKWRLKTA